MRSAYTNLLNNPTTASADMIGRDADHRDRIDALDSPPRAVHFALRSGADPTGATNNGPQLRTLLSELEAAGGNAVVWFSGYYRIEGEVVWPAGVSPQGTGPHSTLFLFYNGGKFTHGDQTTDKRFPPIGGYTIQGSDATIAEAMYVGVTAAASVHDIRFAGTIGTGLNIAGTQNSTFINIDCAITLTTGIIVDLGAANLWFYGCHPSGKTNCVIIRQSGTSSSLIGVAQPSKIHWHGGIIEGDANEAVLVTAGFLVNFFGVTLNGGPTATGVGLKVAPQAGLIVGVNASGSQIRAQGGIGVDASGLSIVTLTNRTEIRDVATAIRHDDSATVRTDGTVDVLVGTGTQLIGTGTAPAGSRLSQAGERRFVLAANESWTSDVSFRTPAGWTLLVAPGEVWVVEAMLIVDAGAAALKYRWLSSPAGAEVGWQLAAPSTASTTANSGVNLRWWAVADWVDGGSLGVGVPLVHRVYARITNPTAASANVALQARQIVSNAEASIIRAGSVMRVRRELR